MPLPSAAVGCNVAALIAALRLAAEAAKTTPCGKVRAALSAGSSMPITAPLSSSTGPPISPGRVAALSRIRPASPFRPCASSTVAGVTTGAGNLSS